MSDLKIFTDLRQSPKRKPSVNSKSDSVDLEMNLTDTAFSLFKEGISRHQKNFASCLRILTDNILETRPKDVKVLLNIAVVKFYQNGLKDVDSFKRSLTEICTQGGIKVDKITPTDEVDASVIRLNHCTLLYHLKHFADAVPLLEEMYKGLDSLEESVSIGLCLLLIECLLALSLPGRALTVVAQTESIFLPQPLPPQTGNKIHNDTTSKGADEADNNLIAKRNIMSSQAGNDLIGGSSELRCSADQELLRGRLYMLRLRCLLMMRVMRLAKKEIKVVVTHAVNSGSQLNVTLIMMKSHLEYLKGSHKRAVKVLNQCASIPPPGPSMGPKLAVAYYNNLGVIHLGLSKPTLACFYLQKSLNELNDSGGSNEGDKCSLYDNGNRVESDLFHNLGVTLIHMNKPAQAFDFLIEAVKTHTNSNNPRLWMRLAECCISLHRQNLESEINPSSLKSCTVIVGAGTYRKICLAPFTVSHDKKLADKQHTVDAALPVPTLEFARLCLRTALILIPDDINTSSLTEEQESSGILPDLYPCQPSPPMKGSQLLNVKLTSLMCSAYVCLCLGDYLMSLRHSQSLLAHVAKHIQVVDDLYKLFGHLYAGESLLYLGRIPEAITHFDPRLVGDINFACKDDSQDAFTSLPSHEQSSRKILLYNLCVAYALKGHYDNASSLLNEISSVKNGATVPAHIIMLNLYIHLQSGNTTAAKKLIKTHIPS